METQSILKILGLESLKNRIIGNGPLESIQKSWALLSKIPRGNLILSRLVGHFVPYTGSIEPEILELTPGHCRVQMSDRPKLRNHLNSIHALAISNLGEVSCGLALNLQLPANYSSILVRLETDYVKKARGPIVSECNIGLVDFSDKHSVWAEATVTDSSGQKVANIKTLWKIGQIDSRKSKEFSSLKGH